MKIGDELIIHAADPQSARQAALTLHAAYCLIEGGMFTLFPGMEGRRNLPSSLEEFEQHEARGERPPVHAEDVLLDEGRGILLDQPGFVVAAQIAA